MKMIKLYRNMSIAYSKVNTICFLLKDLCGPLHSTNDSINKPVKRATWNDSFTYNSV